MFDKLEHKLRVGLGTTLVGEMTVHYFLLLLFLVMHSNKLLLSPRRVTRKISKIPFKVLDAPELQDDFYLNLLDWSSQNVLSVGLGTAVYLWSACTCQVSMYEKERERERLI